MHVQGVHLYKEATLFKGPLILIMPFQALHVNLYKLKNEVTSKYTQVATSELSFISSFLFMAIPSKIRVLGLG